MKDKIKCRYVSHDDDCTCETRTFRAWVVLDENNRAICYLDESLGVELHTTKSNYERQNYKVIPLSGVIA